MFVRRNGFRRGLYYNPDPKVYTIVKDGAGFIGIISGGSTGSVIIGSNGPTAGAAKVKLSFIQDYKWTGAVGASPGVNITGTAAFSGSFAVPGTVPLTGQIDYWNIGAHTLTSFANNGNNYAVNSKYSPVGFLVAGMSTGSCKVDVLSVYSQGPKGTGQQELDVSISP